MVNSQQKSIDLYVFRHGETDFNAEHRLQGNLDTPLNEFGREQANRLADSLKLRGIQIVVASPLQRAFETGKIIGDSLNVETLIEADLREIHGGEAEGILRSEIIKRYGDTFWQRWRSVKKQDMDLRFPGGESKLECQQRAIKAVTKIVTDSRFHTIAVAMHGGILRYLIHSIIGDELAPIPVPNCAVYLLRYFPDSQSWIFVDVKDGID